MAKLVLIICPWYSGAQQEPIDELGHLSDFSRLLGAADEL
jgi:hypothetical protein